MSEVTIEWDIRAMNREVGYIETVERTEFVDALIAQGRVHVLPDGEPVDEEAHVPEVKAVTKPSATRKKFVTAELDSKLAEAEAFTETNGDVQAE